MASKTLIVLTDDLDGSEADQTVRFGLDGLAYEIDLSDRNAQKFRKAVEPFVERARRVGGRAARRGTAQTAASPALIDTKAVRAWAASNGIEVSARGRVPAQVIEQYRAAGH